MAVGGAVVVLDCMGMVDDGRLLAINSGGDVVFGGILEGMEPFAFGTASVVFCGVAVLPVSSTVE